MHFNSKKKVPLNLILHRFLKSYKNIRSNAARFIITFEKIFTPDIKWVIKLIGLNYSLKTSFKILLLIAVLARSSKNGVGFTVSGELICFNTNFFCHTYLFIKIEILRNNFKIFFFVLINKIKLKSDLIFCIKNAREKKKQKKNVIVLTQQIFIYHNPLLNIVASYTETKLCCMQKIQVKCSIKSYKLNSVGCRKWRPLNIKRPPKTGMGVDPKLKTYFWSMAFF
ncbi:hypothetical protein BpHYR1_008296 [Brachionus plicatilis]|uniref:Uncharacterized protein n=1 Tax=Brachionus plicatilis TaxID=10195 RepID=A0A3M7RYM5_BRAPC|nr:hypothetical protein BpHYR1_008296 [Brachionus plicatilis]